METSGEHRHAASTDRWWAEAWSFDVATEDRSLAMFATIVAFANQRRSWYWAAVVRPGRPYVLCRDDGLEFPTEQRPIEMRGEGLWMHAICETPWRHWTVAMEAFAISFDDPTEAWRSERGDRVGLAFDLEWESESTDVEWRTVASYGVVSSVSGEIQVGEEQISLCATGWRSHAWGSLDEVLTGHAPGPGEQRIATAPILVISKVGTRPYERILLDSDGGRPPRWITQIAGK